MKWIMLCLVLLLSGLSVVAQSDFDDAVTAYERDDFAGAIAGFETLIVEGQVSADVYYNLAATCAVAGDTGCAMLNMRRALLYRPRDIGLQTSLAVMRADADLPGIETSDFLIAIGTTTNNLFMLSELAMLVFVLWCVCWLILAISFWLKKWRDVLRYILIVPALLLVLSFSILMLKIAVETLRPEAVIIADVAAIRSGPGDDFLFLYNVPAGTEIRIVEERPDWLRFQTGDNRQGWILREQIEKVVE